MIDDAPRIVPPQGGSGTAPPTGGPAFPRTASADVPGQMGMLLRDYFAAQALAGLLAWSPTDVENQYAPGDAANLAYRIADAMLAERAKQ